MTEDREVYVRDKPFGGADKSSNGHRYDTVPFVNGMIMAGMSCQPIHYRKEEHDAFFDVCSKFDALIVRCNPGQINDDGGDQKKFDDAVRSLQKKGKKVRANSEISGNFPEKNRIFRELQENLRKFENSTV